ncbi:MAG: sensor histidine kinase [Chloroflexi bacterium]|nr:sensor histidine kinase [Chloroflexota bacterium]
MRAATLPPEQPVSVDAPETLYVAAEEAYLKLILMNLVSNASKASDRDGRIEILAEDVRGWAQICVKDYGAGIPLERQETIFERFVTWRPESSPNAGGGVGLGLYICRSLVEAHGGRIWVTSESGQGSTFYFTLRTAKAAAPIPADALGASLAARS